jgi:tRNA A-37 threonylcarbamoyl transferase component Bud32
VPETVLPDKDPTYQPNVGGTVSAAAMPAGYTDLEVLGVGGMGTVYKARNPRLDRWVALKMLRSLRPDLLARFQREARVMARLSHPHIVQVFELIDLNSQPCLVMEYVPGGSLEERLRQTAVSAKESARLLAVIARAVEAAHKAGVVHRDLKPGNVLLAEPVPGSPNNVLGACPKVSDFGLARLAGDQGHTGSGEVLGTPHYMSPEQALGRVNEIGPPTDVWALGVILYRCLTGHLPFKAESTLETLDKVRHEEPRPSFGPDVPPELARLCLRCLEKKPHNRPSMSELASTLELAACSVPDQVPSELPVSRSTPAVASGEWDTQPPVVVTGHAKGGQVTRLTPVAKKRRLAVPLALAAGLLVFCIAGVVLALVLNKGTDGKTPVVINGDNDQDKDAGAKIDRDKVKVKDDSREQVRPEILDQPKVEQRPRVKQFLVKHWKATPIEYTGEIGERVQEAKFGDQVRIEVTFAEPAFAYLIAFNADGEEQLLWPVGEDLQPNDSVAPPLKADFIHPARKGKVWNLDDDEGGGLQAFTVVASVEPLPSFAAWKKKRGAAKWKKLPPGEGVWDGDPEGVTRRPVGMGRPMVRGKEVDEPNRPPLDELCRSLKVGGVETVTGVAFGVKPKEVK